MNDLIAALDYKQFCDHTYTGKEQFSSGIISVSTEHIKKFFQIHGDNGQSYIVVSCCCDYGIHYQREHPVKNDFIKGLQLLQLNDYDGYSAVVIQPRCNLNLCNPTDKYSVKCYAFTHSTFPAIPSNIKKWFLVNSNIDESNVVNMPLGLYFENAKEIFQTLPELSVKSKLLYINWTNYTQERLALKEYFKQFGWCDVDEGRRDFKEFLLNMTKYTYVLCPEGNGLDCHRIIESLYLDCIPILLRNKFNTKTYGGTGVLFVDNWTNITEEFLEAQYGIWLDLPKDKQSIQLNYWRKKIEASRQLLC